MQHRPGLILLSLFFFAFVPGLQAAARWEPLPLWGGEVQVAAPEGGSLVAYAATQWGGGIYRTADGGVSWRFSGYGPNRLTVRILGVDPQDPRRLYAFYDGDHESTFALFRSDDGARHWRRIGQEVLPYVTALTFHPRNPGWLYAATGAGLYASRDRGASWSLLALPDLGLTTVAVAPRAPEVLLVTAWDGLSSKTRRSADGGRTFVEVLEEGPRQLVFDPTRPRRVYGFGGSTFYRSDDLGATWTRFFLSSVETLAVTRTGVLVAGDFGVQRSLDGGTTWLPREGAKIHRPADSITSLAVLQDRILAGGQRGIWRGSAEGLGWQAASDGILAQSIGPMTVAADADSTLWVGVPKGLFVSRDSGGTFRTYGSSASHLAVHPRQPQIAYAMGCCADDESGLLRTDDGGRHWRKLPYPANTIDLQTLEVDPEDPDIVYAGGGWRPSFRCSAFRSTDGGATWDCMTPPGALDFEDLAFDPRDGSILYGLFSYGRLYRSEDRGAHWTLVEYATTPQIISLEADPHQPGRLYGKVFPYGFARSDDGGRTWSRKKLGLPSGKFPARSFVHDILVDPARPGRVYLAVSSSDGTGMRNHVLRSDDAGDHWVDISNGLPQAPVTNLAADPRSADVLYAGTYGHGLYRIRMEE